MEKGYRFSAIIGLLLSTSLLAWGATATCVQQPKSGLIYRVEGKKVQAAEFSCYCNPSPCDRDKLLSAMWEYGPLTDNTITRLKWEANSPSVSKKSRILLGAQIISFGLPYAFDAVRETSLKFLFAGAPAGVKALSDFFQGQPDQFIESRAPGEWETVYTLPTGVTGFQLSILEEKELPKIEPSETPSVLPVFLRAAPWPVTQSEGPTQVGYFIYR